MAHATKTIEALRTEEDEVKVSGFGNPLTNEVMLACDWQVKKAWSFKKEVHINLLGLKPVEALVEDKAKQGPSRFANQVDSNAS